MSKKTDKFVKNVLRKDNVKARETLEEVIQDKVTARMRKILSKQNGSNK